MKLGRHIALAFALIVATMLPLESYALGIIRDAEIENTLHAYGNPIFDAAGIPPENVRILIVSDPSINAYVAGGLNLFIHTGLILATTKPGELIGVMAHETGHIAGAHLSQMREKSNRAMLGSVIGMILGAAAMVAGAGQAGAGVIMGSQSMGQGLMAASTRSIEASADQAGLKFLDACDISASGMLSMFETLRREEGPGANDPFLRDHPLTTERITAMRDHIAESKIPVDQVPDGFAEKHARMKAKLFAYINSYQSTLNLYPASDTSLSARYARTIAEFRHQDLPGALTLVNGLIAERPNDPYFYDTKGQMLFENGKLAESAAAYAKASNFASDSALIMTDYAKTLIALDDPSKLPQALALLERSKEIDDSYDTTWRQLGLAYGKQGRLGLSYEALAEEAALDGDYKTVLQYVAHARSYKDDDPSLALLLDDLEHDAKAQLDHKKKEGNIF